MKHLITGLLLALICVPASADFGVNQLIGFGALERRPGGSPYGSDLITGTGGSQVYSSDDETLGDADNAANESQANFWSTNNYTSGTAPNGHYWRVDFGTGKSHFVTKVEMDQFVFNGDAGTQVIVEGSNDETTWTTLYSDTGDLPTNDQTVTVEFNNTVAYRYYQVRFVRDATNGAIRVEIFRMFESI